MDYEKIKVYCRQKNLSIKELGEKVGMSDAGLYRAFINNSLKVDTLEKIADVLNMPVGVFFNDNDEVVPKLRNYIINHDLTFYFHSNLDSIFVENQSSLTKDLSSFIDSQFDKNEIVFLMDKAREALSEFENIMLLSELANKAKKPDLIAKHFLYRATALEFIQSPDKRKAIKRLQTIMCDKYLDLVKENEVFNFLIRHNLFDNMSFTIELIEYIKIFVEFSTGKELMKSKGFIMPDSK